MRILIAEDESYSMASLVKNVREYAAFRNAEILEAENGREAWEFYEKYSPQLVISDIRMPLMDGIELTRLIHESEKPAYVIIVSGFAEFEYARKAISYGVAGYLLKPIQVKEMYRLFDGYFHSEDRWKTLGDDGTADFRSNANMLLAELLMNRRYFIPAEYNEYILEIVKNFYVLLVYLDTEDKSLIRSSGIAIRQYLNTSTSLMAKCVTINSHFEAILLKNTGENIHLHVSHSIRSILGKIGVFCRIGISEAVRQSIPEEDVSCRPGGNEACGDGNGEMRVQSGISMAFSHAEYAISARFLREETIYEYEKEISRTSYISALDHSSLEALKKYISENRATKASYMVEQAFDVLLQNERSSVQSLLDLLKNIELTLSSCCAEMGRELCVAHFELRKYKNLSALREEIKGYIHSVSAFGNRENAPSEDTVSVILDYIESHYGDNLTLKDLAERRFYMNSSYLSYLVREKTGQTFTSYLTQTRMKHAMELVLGSRFSITDIAGICGYNDTSRFIWMFKKYYGKTPYKFRKVQGVPPQGEKV